MQITVKWSTLVISVHHSPPLSQGISRTRPWCHASQHETWSRVSKISKISKARATLVPPWFHPTCFLPSAVGMAHLARASWIGGLGTSLIYGYLWYIIVYIMKIIYSIWCMRLHCPISNRISLYIIYMSLSSMHIYGVYGGIVGQSHFVTRLSQRSCWGPSTGPSSWAGNSIEPHCHIWSQNVRNIKGPKGPWHDLACELSRSQNVLGIRMERWGESVRKSVDFLFWFSAKSARCDCDSGFGSTKTVKPDGYLSCAEVTLIPQPSTRDLRSSLGQEMQSLLSQIESTSSIMFNLENHIVSSHIKPQNPQLSDMEISFREVLN